MENKLLKPTPIVSPKVSFSSQSPSPLQPLQSNLKKSLSIALITLTLLGGAVFLINKNSEQQADEKAQTVKNFKAEFVRNVLALSDDGYRPVDQYKHEHKHDNHDDHQHGDHQIHDNDKIVVTESVAVDQLPGTDEAVSPALVVVDRQVSALPVVEEAQDSSSDTASDSLSEHEERLRAIESESLSLNISEGIENHHQAERNELLLRKAEEIARYKVAREEAIKRREASRPKPVIANNPLLFQRMTMQLPFLIPQNPQLQTFKGALTKCYIKGHDMHWINDQGWILEHVELDAELSPNVLVARKIIAKKGAGFVVVVYEKGYEAYDSLGNLIETGNKE